MSKRRQFGSRWFRVYDESVDDPKIQMLTDRLHRFWFNFMCLASKNDGYLPPVTEMAWRLRKTEATVTAMVAELYERGLLDREADTFSPHNWFSRQFESDISTPRVKKHRERHQGVSETFHSAFPKRGETVSETHQNRTEQNRTDTEQTADVRMPAVSEFPETAIVIRQAFPSAPDPLVIEVAHLSVQAYVDAIGGSAGMPDLTDALIAEAVREAHFRKQENPYAYKTTVPRVVRTWAEEALRLTR